MERLSNVVGEGS